MTTPTSSVASPDNLPFYIPPNHLLSHSLLSASQLTFSFQQFYASLDHVSYAPALVFDQLVSKLNDYFNAALEQERLDHTARLERERVKHTAALEQEGLRSAAALEKERIECTGVIERERLRHATFDERGRIENATALREERLKLINTIDEERSSYTATIKKFQDEIKVLQSSNDQLRREFAELREVAPVSSASIQGKAAVMEKSLVIGTFLTTEVQESTSTGASRVVSLTKPYSTPPEVIVGLNMLDLGCANNVRVKTYACWVQTNVFTIGLSILGNTKFYKGGCTWLEIEKEDLDFQFGTFSTTEDHSASKPQTLTSRRITFPREFPEAPHVVVWLTAFDMSNQKIWRVKTYATSITETAFTIHIDTWMDSVLYSATASWIAYPANKPNIFSGSFSTLDVRSWGSAQRNTRANVKFDKNVFVTPPRTFLALNSLDINHCHNLRIKTTISSVSTAGMTWHIDGWSDTLLYSAGASYIALG